MATTSVGEFNPRTRSFVLSPDLMRWVMAAVGVLTMWALWQATARHRGRVDGVTVTVNTHRRHVRELIVDLGVIYIPMIASARRWRRRLSQAQGVVVERARPVQIVVDGRTIQSATWGPTPRALLADAEVLVLDPYDSVVVGDTPMGLDDPLPTTREQVITRSEFAPVRPWARTEGAAAASTCCACRAGGCQ